MIKPDGVARGLVDGIKQRIEKSGLKIVKSRDLTVSEEQARKLYAVHKEKPFYSGLVKLITSGPSHAIEIEGENAVSRLRKLMGATDPRQADPGTIRGDYKEDNIYTADGTMKNVIHGSDCTENAKHEAAIFF